LREGTVMKIFGNILIVFCLVFFSLNGKTQSDEYMMKAAFLEKFARFSEWPEGLDTFQITVIGNNPFNEKIGSIYSTVKIKNKPVRVRYIKRIDNILSPQILFISSSEKKNIRKILEKTRGQHILTISETPGFCEEGVILNFYNTDEGTIHFEINKTALKESGIEMDVYLLEYAKLIDK